MGTASGGVDAGGTGGARGGHGGWGGGDSGGGARVTRYRMRLLSTSLGAVGEYYRIEDEDGRVRFRVESRVVTFWPAVSLGNAEGHTLMSIQRRGMNPQSTYRVSRDGQEVATVRQEWASGHQSFVVEVVGAGAIEMLGDWQAQTFAFRREIARMVGEWFSVGVV